MSGFVSHITGARQAARVASVEARGEQFNAGTPAVLLEGIITAVTGDTYTADVLGDDGAVVATFERLRTWPVTTLAIGTGVYLKFDAGSAGEHPTIFAGGGGSCRTAYNEWGVLFG